MALLKHSSIVFGSIGVLGLIEVVLAPNKSGQDGFIDSFFALQRSLVSRAIFKIASATKICSDVTIDETNSDFRRIIRNLQIARFWNDASQMHPVLLDPYRRVIPLNTREIPWFMRPVLKAAPAIDHPETLRYVTALAAVADGHCAVVMAESLADVVSFRDFLLDPRTQRSLVQDVRNGRILDRGVSECPLDAVDKFALERQLLKKPNPDRARKMQQAGNAAASMKRLLEELAVVVVSEPVSQAEIESWQMLEPSIAVLVRE